MWGDVGALVEDEQEWWVERPAGAGGAFVGGGDEFLDSVAKSGWRRCCSCAGAAR